jgi:uncharacterized protein YjdB
MRSALLVIVLGSMTIGLGCAGGSKTVSNTPILKSIQVSAPSGNIVVGQSQQITATGVYSDNTTKDITTAVNWSSSSPSVITIAASGLLTAKASGAVSITATMNSVSGSVSITVLPALVSISVSPGSPSIAPGTTVQLTATAIYSDNSTQNVTASVAWASSNQTIATVSNTSPTKGLAKASASGNTTITASLGSISGTASLTITTATATSIVVTPSNASLPLFTTQQYIAMATFSDGTSQDITGVATWSSSAPAIASITVSGLAIAKGVTNTSIFITAAFGQITGSAGLTVNAANLSSISIQPATGSIAQGTKLQFTATGTFTDGGTRNITSQVNWTSTDNTIASIGTSSGFLSGIAPGIVTITAALGSVTASVPLNVTGAKIVSISVSSTSGTIPIGGHASFTATGLFDDSSSQDITTSAAWTSNNNAVATVGATSGNYGTVTGIGTGTTNINAAFTYGTASAAGSATVSVSSVHLTGIAVTPTSGLIAPASIMQYRVVGLFSDNTTQSLFSGVTWSSSNTSVATVSATGAATGQAVGNVTITAQVASYSATVNLVVEPGPPTSIKVNSQNPTVPAGINLQFTAIGRFVNGDTQDLTSSVTWTSSSSSVATVSNASGSIGLATGVNQGTTTITAAFSGQAGGAPILGTAPLTVTNAKLTAVSVSPATAFISAGSSQQFSATGTFDDGSVQTITGQTAWSSSNVSVASITSHGLASSAAAGSTTITASLDGVTGTAILNVH